MTTHTTGTAEEWPAARPTPVGAPGPGTADWLSLAAAPTFAVMALLTLAGGAPDMLCWASPLTGMVPMYLLMSAFHSAPWLKLLSRSPARRYPLVHQVHLTKPRQGEEP